MHASERNLNLSDDDSGSSIGGTALVQKDKNNNTETTFKNRNK